MTLAGRMPGGYLTAEDAVAAGLEAVAVGAAGLAAVWALAAAAVAASIRIKALHFIGDFYSNGSFTGVYQATAAEIINAGVSRRTLV
jgi:hypothetical protein